MTVLTLDDAYRAAATAELSEAQIEPWTIDDAASRWTEDVQRPFSRGSKAAVHAGGLRGDMTNRRLCQNVEREYSALRAPSKLDVETAAAALQLLDLPRGREPWGAPLVGAWIAHAGLSFALEAFVRTLWNRSCVVDRGTKARELKIVPHRTLEDLFARRTDRAIHAAWRGATDDARAAARQKAEQLRQNSSLLERSALASCVLDRAWIDADLREHATTKARAMLSPEALLVAGSPADIAAYLAAQGAEEHGFYPVFNEYDDRRGNAVVAGHSYVERFGEAGVDLACERLQRRLATLSSPNHAAAAAGELIALLRVISCARDHAPTIAAAIAVIDLWEAHHPADCGDPRPLAYDCLRASPAGALAALRGHRRGWVKNLVENLIEQLEPRGAAASEASPEAAVQALPAALRADAPPPPAFFRPAVLPRIAMRGGTFPLDRLPSLAACLAAGDAATLRALGALADPASLAAFGWAVFDIWATGSRSDAGPPWPVTQLAMTGDAEVARRLAAVVRGWPREGRIAHAVAAVDALIRIDDPIALVHVGLMAHASESTTLQGAAWQALEAVAADRKLTPDQLLDRAVPDLGAARDGSIALDVGREVRVGFGPGLEPFVRDADGKSLKALPRARRGENAALFRQASARWTAIKDDAKAIARLHVARLEIALGTGRRWTGDELRAFAARPLISLLLGDLIWGVYDGNAVASTFRIDGGPLDVAPAMRIGLVHPLHLPVAERKAWLARLRAPAFKQLDRKLYTLDDSERAERALARFVGRTVATSRLLRLLARGWQQDGWGVDCFAFVKPIDGGHRARLTFEDGIQPEGSEYVDEIQRLGQLTIGVGHGDAPVVLGSVDSAVICELIADIERIGTAD